MKKRNWRRKMIEKFEELEVVETYCCDKCAVGDERVYEVYIARVDGVETLHLCSQCFLYTTNAICYGKVENDN